MSKSASSDAKSNSKALWGGRFTTGAAERLRDYTESVSFDLPARHRRQHRPREDARADQGSHAKRA
jgi:hypothetical protein